eukprot:COSAG01_NODE_15331_length_1348_cov_2.346677_1_plen_261_part_01
MAEEPEQSEAELQAELERMQAEGDEAMADVTVEDAVRAPTPPAPLELDEGAGADTTTPKSPYRAPRDPVPLGKYTALKISKIRAQPEMDSEEEGNYMKGDEFEVTEVVEVSGKTGQAPRVRGRTEMGWITLRLGDNVNKVEDAVRAPWPPALAEESGVSEAELAAESNDIEPEPESVSDTNNQGGTKNLSLEDAFSALIEAAQLVVFDEIPAMDAGGPMQQELLRKALNTSISEKDPMTRKSQQIAFSRCVELGSLLSDAE